MRLRRKVLRVPEVSDAWRVVHGEGDDLPGGTAGSGGDGTGLTGAPGMSPDDPSGCGCRSGGGGGRLAWLMPVVALGLRRRWRA